MSLLYFLDNLECKARNIPFHFLYSIINVLDHAHNIGYANEKSFITYAAQIKPVRRYCSCIYSSLHIGDHITTFLSRGWKPRPVRIRHWCLHIIMDCISRSMRPMSSCSCWTNVRAGLLRPRLPWLGGPNHLKNQTNDQLVWICLVLLYLWLLVLLRIVFYYSHGLSKWIPIMISVVLWSSHLFSLLVFLWGSVPHYHIVTLPPPLSETVAFWSC